MFGEYLITKEELKLATDCYCEGFDLQTKKVPYISTTTTLCTIHFEARFLCGGGSENQMRNCCAFSEEPHNEKKYTVTKQGNSRRPVCKMWLAAFRSGTLVNHLYLVRMHTFFMVAL